MILVRSPIHNDHLKLAVIGAGNMGCLHARNVTLLPNTALTAVCDIIPDRAERISRELNCRAFTDVQALLSAGELEAVIIATPHYAHTPLAIECLQRGIHVLTEKPLAVHVADGERMIRAYRQALKQHANLRFAIMFQMRTFGYWRKVKQMISDGRLGRLVRATWIITDWYRTQCYYDQDGWRATWAGEGGGVLINQCPHNLDLYQWFFGMPARVTAVASCGKYHHVEVEDEVSAVFEHADGMIGQFTTTTAESPGTNRLEIIGEFGKLVMENGKLSFWHNHTSMLENIQTSPDPYGGVEHHTEEVLFEHHNQPGHALIIENFASAIMTGCPLWVPAAEGIHQVHLGNAIMLASVLRRTLALPMDAGFYAAWLADQVKNSTFHKVVRNNLEPMDMEKSFSS